MPGLPTPPSSRRVGRYELLRPIGRGGTGEVWEALLHGPHGFRKAVAVKLLREGPSETDRDGLVREARLGALLSHPNVVSTLELGEHDGRWFVAMELVHGPSLAELARDGPLSAPALVDAGVQACAALSHVHRLRAEGVDEVRGLVHRDVKPQNLLLDRSGILKLADLGIARFSGGSGGASGTPGYMPPEQVLGHEDPRADLFALGVTLFVLATGERPFGSGAAAWERVRWVEQRLADPAFLAPVDDRLPGLGAIVARCLRFEPAHRFQRATDVAAALRVLRPAPGPSLLDHFARVRPKGVSEELRGYVPTAHEPTSAARPAGNLPPIQGPLLGRDADLERIRSLVAPGTVVTVLGPGGMGKTRLAIEVARQLSLEFGGGAWFCDLTEARTGFGVALGVAQVLGVPLLTTDAAATVGHALRGRGPILVVLDNFEQVADHARDTVGAWVASCPEAAFLVTSQRALGLGAEVTEVLGPLSPAAGADLFTLRAPRPPAPAERAEVEDLAAALDGMPLAIELAAARTRVMGVKAMRQRLDERFRLLAGGSEDRPVRHRSLRASLDASWELLAEGARRAAARLTVCSGGFSLATAERLLPPDPDGTWALDLLTELVESSFLWVDGDRFRMLVGIAAHVAEHLEPAERAAAERTHGAVFAELAERADDAELALELDNLLAASRRAVERGDGAVAARTAVAAVRRLEDHGPYASALSLLDRVLALPEAGDDRERSRLLRARARISGRTGRGEAALADATRALELARRVDDPVGALEDLALLVRESGRGVEAAALYEEAEQHARARVDRRALAGVLCGLGHVRIHLGRYPEARSALDEALGLARWLGEPTVEGTVLSNLAALYTDLARHEEARDACIAAVALHRTTRNRRLEAGALANLGLAEMHVGRTEHARTALEQARALHVALGDRRAEAIDLAHLARVYESDGRADDARDALQRSASRSREMGDVPRLVSTLQQLAVLEHIAGRTQEARAAYHEALQLAERHHEARFVAQISMNLGVLLADNGDLDGGVALLTRAASAYAELGLAAGRALTLCNLGGALMELGRYAEARERLLEAVSAARGTRSAWALGSALLGLGESCLEDGRRADARTAFEEAVAVMGALGREAGARPRASLARLLRLEGNLAAAEEALALADAQSTSRDTTAPAWIELGRLRLAQGRPQEALEAAARAIDLTNAFLPMRALAWCARSRALDELGRRSEAEAALAEARRLADRVGAAPDSPLRREVARTEAALAS